MNYETMLQKVKDGGNVRLPGWPTNEYLYLDEGVVSIHYAFGVPNRYVPSDEDIDSNDWYSM